MTSDSPRKPLVVGTIGMRSSELNTMKAVQNAGSALIVSTGDKERTGYNAGGDRFELDSRGGMMKDPANPDGRHEASYTTEPCMCGVCTKCHDRDRLELRSRMTPRRLSAFIGMAFGSMMDNPMMNDFHEPPPRGDKALLKAKCIREGCSCSKTPGKAYCSPECAHIDRIDKKRSRTR